MLYLADGAFHLQGALVLGAVNAELVAPTAIPRQQQEELFREMKSRNMLLGMDQSFHSHFYSPIICLSAHLV